MKVEMTKQVLNDKSCREYSLVVAKKDMELTIKEDLETPTEKEQDKYFKIIEEEIPEDETITSDYMGLWRDPNNITFRIYTRKKEIIKKEKEIIKLLYDNGLKIETYDINLSEDGWVELSPWCSYTEHNLMKLKELLGAETFEVCFDGHMERQFLMYKLKI